MNYNKSVEDFIVPFIMDEIIAKVGEQSTDWTLSIDNYTLIPAKESFDYYKNNKLDCKFELKIEYSIHKKKGGGVIRENVSVFIPQMVNSAFVLGGVVRTHKSYFSKGNDLDIGPSYIKIGDNGYEVTKGKVGIYIKGIGVESISIDKLDTPKKDFPGGIEFYESLNIDKRTQKKIEVVYGWKPGNRITKELLEKMVLDFRPTMRDHAVTKVLLTVDRSFYLHLEKCKYKILRAMNGDFYKNVGLYVKTLQSNINNFFNGRSESIESVQYPDNTNELDYLVSSKKVIMETNYGAKVPITRFNETFFDVVDASVSPDNANINRMNELAQIVEVLADGELRVRVLTKNFKEVTIDLLDYMLAHVLHYEQVDYDEKSVAPKKSYKVKYRADIIESPTYDYIDLPPDERLATTTRMIPMVNSSDSIRVAMASKMTRQAVSCYQAEPPLIATGHEKVPGTSPLSKYSNLKENIKVTKSDPFEGVIECKGVSTGKKYKFDIPSPIYSQKRNALVFEPAKEGQEIRPGDLIYRSKNVAENGEFQLGINLFTAYMYWRGYDFEDSIIISESAAKKLTHMGETIVEFDLKPGDRIENILPPGTVVNCRMYNSKYPNKLAELKRDVQMTTSLEGLNNIVSEKQTHTKTIDILVPSNIDYAMVGSVEFYEVKRDVKQREYLTQVQKISYKTNDTAVGQKEFLNDYGNYPVRRVDVPSKLPKTETTGISYKVYVKLIIANVMKEGDKISNRYGSKGVIGKVVPDAEMPKTKDGRIIEIIMNPSSTIARKNLPQISEINLSRISKEVYRRIDLMDKSSKNWSTMQNLLRKAKFTNLAKLKHSEFMQYHNSLKDSPIKYQYVTGALSTFTPVVVAGLLKEFGLSDREKLFDGKRGREINQEIQVGYAYYMKLHHVADFVNKITTDNPKDRNKLALNVGLVRSEGQVLGEMELVALLAHGKDEFLTSMRSDRKIDWFLVNMIQSNNVIADEKGRAFLVERNVRKNKRKNYE